MSFPQILMLGNGLNRAYSKDDWNDFLRKCSNMGEKEYEQLCSPMPLRAIIATDNNIYNSIRAKKEELIKQCISNEYMKSLQNILSIGFNQIITTNYTYELEASLANKLSITENYIKKLSAFIPDRTTYQVEPKFLLRSYNKSSVNIWHIHGEIRKPDSIILGHYNYSALLSKLKGFSESRGNYYQKKELNGKEINYKSWIDYFIMGDIYVLGFGFDFSEFDLWWLLNRKYNEKASHGKLYFFEPEQDEGKTEKERLLELFDAKIEHCNIIIPKIKDDKSNKDEVNSKYFEFYKHATDRIKELVEENK